MGHRSGALGRRSSLCQMFVILKSIADHVDSLGPVSRLMLGDPCSVEALTSSWRRPKCVVEPAMLRRLAYLLPLTPSEPGGCERRSSRPDSKQALTPSRLQAWCRASTSNDCEACRCWSSQCSRGSASGVANASALAHGLQGTTRRCRWRSTGSQRPRTWNRRCVEGRRGG